MDNGENKCFKCVELDVFSILYIRKLISILKHAKCVCVCLYLCVVFHNSHLLPVYISLPVLLLTFFSSVAHVIVIHSYTHTHTHTQVSAPHTKCTKQRRLRNSSNVR